MADLKLGLVAEPFSIHISLQNLEIGLLCMQNRCLSQNKQSAFFFLFTILAAQELHVRES